MFGADIEDGHWPTRAMMGFGAAFLIPAGLEKGKHPIPAAAGGHRRILFQHMKTRRWC